MKLVPRVQTQTSNYRDKIRMRFNQQINDIVSKHSLSQLVIVLDSISAFLLSNVFSITDLVGMKILYIERLEKKRKKLDKHALYFITPTKNNIQLLIQDFPVLTQQKQAPQYRRIHILFTTFIDQSLLRQLAIQKGVLKRIARNSLKQFYFSARILAPNLVDMNLSYLAVAFSKQNQEEEIKRQLICKKIVEFIANHDSVNTVRIFFKKSANMVCQRLAYSLEKIVKNYLGILLQNRSPNIKKDAPDLTIFLLDRSIDTVTPFIHYLTYQSLLFDFFPISMVTKTQLQDKGSYSYQQIQNQTYNRFRYKHISQALQKLPQTLQDAKGKLESIKQINSQKIDIRQLKEDVQQIKSNIQKLQAIWKEFKNQKIDQLAELQQCIATGITPNLQATKSVELVDQVIKMCKNNAVSREQKLRFGIMAITCIKLSKEDYQRLLEQFNEEDKKILKNMIALGVSYDGSVLKSTKTVTKDQQKIAQQRMKQTGMPLNRYSSIVQLVLPLFCKKLSDPIQSQTMDKDTIGQIVCPIFKNDESQIKYRQDRFAITMIGGISWSQISAIRSIKQLQNVVIMADSVMNASQFLKEVSKINILNY